MAINGLKQGSSWNASNDRLELFHRTVRHSNTSCQSSAEGQSKPKIVSNWFCQRRRSERCLRFSVASSMWLQSLERWSRGRLPTISCHETRTTSHCCYIVNIMTIRLCYLNLVGHKMIFDFLQNKIFHKTEITTETFCLCLSVHTLWLVNICLRDFMDNQS